MLFQVLRKSSEAGAAGELTALVLARIPTAAQCMSHVKQRMQCLCKQCKQCLCKGLTWLWTSHAGGMLPSVTIEYRDVEIEADALVGSSSVPSLTNAAWGFLKVCC